MAELCRGKSSPQHCVSIKKEPHHPRRSNQAEVVPEGLWDLETGGLHHSQALRHKWLYGHQLGDRRLLATRSDNDRLTCCAFLTSSDSLVLASKIVAVVIAPP